MVARFDKTSVKEMENTVKRLQHVGVKAAAQSSTILLNPAALFYSSGYSQCDYGYASKKKEQALARKNNPSPGGRG